LLERLKRGKQSRSDEELFVAREVAGCKWLRNRRMKESRVRVRELLDEAQRGWGSEDQETLSWLFPVQSKSALINHNRATEAEMAGIHSTSCQETVDRHRAVPLRALIKNLW
jgi:hypothetical protein